MGGRLTASAVIKLMSPAQREALLQGFAEFMQATDTDLPDPSEDAEEAWGLIQREWRTR